MGDVKTSTASHIEQSILNQCRRLVSLVHVASKNSEMLSGLSAAQLFVLKALSKGHAHSLNDLAILTHTHQSSVSAVVKKLVDKKYVKGQPSTEDARRLELRITTIGKKALESSPEPVQEKIIRGIRSLSPHDRKELNHLMSLMLDGIEDPKHPPRMFLED